MTLLKGEDANATASFAFVLLKNAAEEGYPEAMTSVGYLYAKGIGVEKNNSEAIAWYAKAAQIGLPKAQLNLGSLMLAKRDGNPASREEAISWMKKASDQNLLEADIALGELYFFGGTGIPFDHEKAYPLLLKAALRGHANSQNLVGYLLKEGDGVERDERAAAEWFLKAAEQGNSHGMVHLAKCYQSGLGVEKNEVEALKWYYLAREKNEAAAAAFLNDYLVNDENRASFSEAEKLAKAMLEDQKPRQSEKPGKESAK